MPAWSRSAAAWSGDMAGFAAACYQRGVDFVQVPTTLLAQVDSSVGGKTGVNHPGRQEPDRRLSPAGAVLSDTATLRTLPTARTARRARRGDQVRPDRRRRTSSTGSRPTWKRCCALDPAALAHAIRRSCEIKAEIVAEDEREQGRRALLNLGHTFGHAIETAAGYGEWLHGEAVAPAWCSRRTSRRGSAGSARRRCERVRELLQRVRTAGRPRRRSAPTRALELMGMDKKVVAGRIRLVLLDRHRRSAYHRRLRRRGAAGRRCAAHFGGDGA